MINHRRIATALAGQALGHAFIYQEEGTSTNDVTLQLASEGHPEGTVVMAGHQTSGRGRRGTRWESQAGDSMMLSILLRPQFPQKHWGRITHAAALALCQALEKTSELRPQIKWPNDVLIDEKKLAGILAESASGAVILGIGANVRAVAPEVRDLATSTSEAGAPELSIEELTVEFLRCMASTYATCANNFSELLPAISQRSALLDRSITYLQDGQEKRGTVLRLGPEGELVIFDEKGQEILVQSADRVRA